MQCKLANDTLVVRGFKGEDIIEIIKAACDKYDVKAGFVTGIGAVDQCSLGVFDVPSKVYHKNVFEGTYEVASLVGNITQMDGKPYTHLHIVLADKHGNAFGGHLNDSRISVTMELFIKVIDMKIDRELDEEIGINMMKFE
nr:DNA-binding protein [uncultured Criibacterium sp.]